MQIFLTPFTLSLIKESWKVQKHRYRVCGFTLWLLKLWSCKQQPMKERECKVYCVPLYKLASGWSCLKQTWWPAVERQGAKNSISQLESWKGTRRTDVCKPQKSLVFPDTGQSVPALAAGFGKRSLVSCDSKLMALCHSCRVFQAAGRTFLGSIFSLSE